MTHIHRGPIFLLLSLDRQVGVPPSVLSSWSHEFIWWRLCNDAQSATFTIGTCHIYSCILKIKSLLTPCCPLATFYELEIVFYRPTYIIEMYSFLVSLIPYSDILSFCEFLLFSPPHLKSPTFRSRCHIAVWLRKEHSTNKLNNFFLVISYPDFLGMRMYEILKINVDSLMFFHSLHVSKHINESYTYSL